MGTTMTLHEVCKKHNGHFDSDTPERDCWRFHTAKQAIAAAALLGAIISLDESYLSRAAMLYTARHGGLAFGVEAIKDEPGPGEEFKKKAGYWRRTFAVSTRSSEERLADADRLVRYCQPPGRSEGFWRYCPSDGIWRDTSKDTCRSLLYGEFDRDKERIELTLGAAVNHVWNLDLQPFQPEYPGDRVWNLDAPQLRFTPEPGPHPHWDLILQHIGADLDTVLGPGKGAEYIKLWLASLIQRPTLPLPYLFLFGEQNSGKSTLHEAFRLLITRGAVQADRALTSEFNGELAYAVLAYIEETNVAQCKGAYNRLKALVTNPTVPIRRMRCDQFELPNTTHWIQTANDRSYCPLFPGDSRITMIHVSVPEREIPKLELMRLCKAEGPAFTHTLLTTVLPEPDGRLGLPVISTAAKEAAMEEAAPALARAVAELMQDRSEWSGTSVELLGALQSEEKLPTHGRVIRRELEDSGPYFKPRGISVSYGKKTDKGLPIRITKA